MNVCSVVFMKALLPSCVQKDNCKGVVVIFPNVTVHPMKQQNKPVA